MVVDIRHGTAAVIVLLGSLPPVTIQLGFSLPAFHISSFDCRKTVFTFCASQLINRQLECLFSFVQPRDLGWAIGRKNCTVRKIVVITPSIYFSAGLVLLWSVFKNIRASEYEYRNTGNVVGISFYGNHHAKTTLINMYFKTQDSVESKNTLSANIDHQYFWCFSLCLCIVEDGTEVVLLCEVS